MPICLKTKFVYRGVWTTLAEWGSTNYPAPKNNNLLMVNLLTTSTNIYIICQIK